jgi:AbrB family looped-hinge helix DNA binding protein
MKITRLSTKGQISLPRGIRESRAWGPGTAFTIEETSDGILLRPAGQFPVTSPEEAADCLGSNQKAATLAQIHAAIGRAVRRGLYRGLY